MSRHQIPDAISEFVTVSIGSIVIGVGIGLLCSLLFKHSRIGTYPTYEIGLLFLFAYGSYAMAEVTNPHGKLPHLGCGDTHTAIYPCIINAIALSEPLPCPCPLAPFPQAVELSGIMSLFFCGIVLAHYNSYNLSEVSKVRFV
jgi:solute carrier family 9 (sodium/hydrogen exchanger), member 8